LLARGEIAVAKLTQTEVKEKAESYAAKMAEYDKLVTKYEAATKDIGERHQKELEELLEKHETELAPIAKKHLPKIEKISIEIEALYGEVIDWLQSQKKSIKLESSSAIAEFFKGKKELPGRVASVKDFLGYVKTKGEDAVYACMNVVLKDAEKLIGKTELDKIASKPKKDVEKATLTLKD